MTETWAAVVGWEGLYEVSDRGRVRGLDRIIQRGNSSMRIPGRMKVAQANHDGRLRVHLQRAGSSVKLQVHRLVLQAFVGPCPPGMECRHLNGDEQDNRVENLRWGTPSENARDRVRHGTHNRTSRTHCPRGHALEPRNLVARRPGHRTCLACARARAYVHYHRSERAQLQSISDNYHRAITQEVRS